MGFQLVVMFIDSFMGDVTYVKDVEDCVERMICCIQGCMCYGSENFGLGSLHDKYVGLAGATPQFYSVAPHRFDFRFVDE
jgi:hypothetical protein